MTAWRAHPLAMDADARLLVCSPAAQAVAYRLAARAVAGRVAVGGNARAAVRAICGGAEWALSGLDELEQEALVDLQGVEVVLAWEWPTLGAPAPAAAASAPALDAQRDDRAAEKNLRAHWYNARAATPEARAAWIQSPAGVRFLAREAERAPGADRSAAWAMTFAVVTENRGRFGARADGDKHGDKSRRQVIAADGDKHGDKPSPLPAPLSSEKKREDDGTHGDKRGDNDGDKIDAAAAVVRSLVLGGKGGVVAPDLTTAQALGAVLLAAGVTEAEAAAWGADLASPTGRKITWPWLRQVEREVDASFLRSCDMSRGEEPWCRVRDGLAAWRHTHAKRLRAAAQPAPRPAAPKTPDEPSVESTAAEMRRLKAERDAKAKTPKEMTHG